MQDQPNEAAPERVADLSQNVLLFLMLGDPSPGLWSTEELSKALGDPIATHDALTELHAYGLVHRQGEFVWPTRAAVRAVQVQDAA